MDVSTEIARRLRHEPDCAGGGFDFETLEPAGRPGVIVITVADCKGCDASLLDVELSTYNPVTGEHWNVAEATAAWNGSMDRVGRERNGPHRWLLHGKPGSWHWSFFNFGTWTGRVYIRPEGFLWAIYSYDTGEQLHSGITTSLYEAYQSVEQGKPVTRL